MTQTPPPPPPPPAEPMWHCMVNGQQTGPLTAPALMSLVQAGTVTTATMVWREGMTAWVAAGSLPELAFAFQASGGKKEAALGLNTNGLIIFIVLLFFCVPLCWLPWVIDDLKAKP